MSLFRTSFFCLFFTVFIGPLVGQFAGTKVGVTRCGDRLSKRTCEYYLKRGYCHLSQAALRYSCAKTCGWCCADGTLASRPYLIGCTDRSRCLGRMDRLGYKECQKLRRKFICSDPRNYDIMRYACEVTCQWCCIKDTDYKTPADGPGYKRCAYKLCYNLESDDICAKNKSADATFCRVKRNKDKCAWTCGACKAPHPMKTCESLPLNQRPYGCCWDGTPAIRPQGQFRCARRCVDKHPHPCKQWQQDCKGTGQYNVRTFLERSCPCTCGRCQCWAPHQITSGV